MAHMRTGWLFFVVCCSLALRVYPAEMPKRLLVLGDSIAAGHGVDPEQAYPALLQRKIDSSGFNWKVVNAGVSGDTTAGGLRRISWLLRSPVDLLLLELGGNDGLRGISPDETEKNLDGIIEKVRAKNPQARIIVAGMRMPPSAGLEFTKKFHDAFIHAAEKNHATLIPFVLEGVGGKPELNQPDRIHPTPEGHRLVAGNIWKVLEPILREEIQRGHGSNATSPGGSKDPRRPG